MDTSENDRERFFRQYVETALWSSNDDEGNPLDDDHGAEDIDPDSAARMRLECDAFITEQSADLEGLDAEQAGHDFWLTRNRHGAGFWDRGYGDLGTRLTDASDVYGEVYLYVGNDGRIYAN